jgi:chromosome segregation ATPase
LPQADLAACCHPSGDVICLLCLPCAAPCLLVCLQERRDLRSGIPANQQALAAELANLRAQLAGVEGRLDAQQRELLEAEAAAEGGAQKLSGLRERVKRKREEVTGWQQQLAAQQQQLEELRGQRQALEEASREVTADFLRSTQEQVDGYKRRVGERRGACERASVAASGARQCINEREAALLLAKKEATEAGRAVGDGQRRLERAQRDLQRLQSATGECAVVFLDAACLWDICCCCRGGFL